MNSFRRMRTVEASSSSAKPEDASTDCEEAVTTYGKMIACQIQYFLHSLLASLVLTCSAFSGPVSSSL